MSFTKEQLDAILHSKGNLLVSASAGSGKTHTVIERLKRLIIQEGVKVSEVLAVTFTEAAATDMKDKLKKALINAVNGDYSRELYGQLNDEQILNLAEQLKEISTADISTMHSFCARLIRSYFFVAEVLPDFKILDQAEANAIKLNCMDRVFAEFYEQGEDWFFNLVDRHSQKRTDGEFKKTMLSAYEFCDQEAYPEQFALTYEQIYTEENLKSLLDWQLKTIKSELDELLIGVSNAVRVFDEIFFPKCNKIALSLLGTLKELIALKDVYAYRNFVFVGQDLRSSEKKKSDYQKEWSAIKQANGEISSILDKLKKVLGENYNSDVKCFNECKEHTAGIVKILKRFREVYSQEKAEENGLDFNDLEHFALKVLSDEATRKEIKEKYKYIFIDEFQDTNGVQDRIVSMLSNDNVFMVGDDKQSIYGFRGSSSKFFTKKMSDMQKSNEKIIRLNNNFRSADKVIEFVNAVFNHCMTDDVYGNDYRNSALIRGGLYPEDKSGRVELHFLQTEKEEKETEEPRIYDVITEQVFEGKDNSLLQAKMIAKIIDEELVKTYYCIKDKKEKQITYKDIAILCRAKNGEYISELISGLIRCGVPVGTETKENVCDYPEIQTLINILKLVDCALQDYPLASTLKSPVGGFCEEELYDIVRYCEDNCLDTYATFSDSVQYYLEYGNNLAIKNKLQDFFDFLHKLRTLSDFIGAHGVLNNVIIKSNYEAYCYVQKQGESMVERVKRFVASSIVNGKTLTIKEFLNRIEKSPDSFGISPFTNEDTVKVMTIHKSKGLEFPVVIVCGLERPFNKSDEYKDIIFSREMGFIVKKYDDKKRIKRDTVLREYAKQLLDEELVKEEMRLLYVALTRATYSMHVLFCGREDGRIQEVSKKSRRYLDFIPAYLGVTVHQASEIELSTNSATPRKVYVLDGDEAKTKKMKENFAYEYPFIEDSLLPLKGSVTALLKSDPENDGEYKAEVLFEDDKTDTESGTIAHKILEEYDFLSSSNLYSQVEDMINRGTLNAEQIKKVNLDRIEKALNSNAFNDISSSKLLREQSFLVNIEANKIFETLSKEPVLLQGIIDLLVLTETGAQIIDYKYSVLDSISLKKKYKKQLQLYSYAVENITGRKVEKKWIVNIFTGQTVLID